MKKRKIAETMAVIVSVFALCVLTACGAGSDSSAPAAAKAQGNSMADGAAYASEEAYMDDVYDYDGGSYDESNNVEVQDTGRKLIKNVSMSVETEDMDTLMGNVNARISACGGYVEYSHVNNGGSAGSSKYATITARIPSKNLDVFLDNVEKISNITSKDINVNDVTLQYADTEARKVSLKTEQDRLYELVAQAETVEEIIYIEDRLSEVRYELESIERQLRTYDNQVDYSTVNMDINEVKKFTPTEEPTRWQKITEGFVDNLADVWEGILDFVTDFIIAIPTLTIIGIINLVIFLIIMGNVKKSRKKRAKRAEMMANNQNLSPKTPVNMAPQATYQVPVNMAPQAASKAPANMKAPTAGQVTPEAQKTVEQPK